MADSVASAHEDLSRLSGLDRSLLYVFIVGPGTGEGIAVALPGAGWLLVDACKVGAEAPLRTIVERFRRRDLDEPIDLVLTHPHEDHASGLAECVEALRPSAIHLTARTPSGPHLLACAHAWLRSSGVTSSRLRASQVVYALQAIEAWETHTNRTVSMMVDGTAFLRGPVEIRACAPRPGPHLDRVLDRLARGDRGRANEASIVLELQWGSTRLVLGADLPRVRGETLVPTGWDAVMAAHPRLANHALLKVPHHGSAEAHHDALMGASEAERIWTLTPFNRVPLPELDHAVLRMIEMQPLHLTHPPGAWSVPDHDGSVRWSAIRLRHVVDATGDAFADAGVDITPRVPREPLAPCWCFAFDEGGALRATYRGRTAVAVLR